MVGLIVRLRFAMWRTAMTRSPIHLVSSILGGLAALGVLAEDTTAGITRGGSLHQRFLELVGASDAGGDGLSWLG